MEPIIKTTYAEYHTTDDQKSAAILSVGTNNSVEKVEEIFTQCIQMGIEIIHVANANDEIKNFLKGFESSLVFYPSYNDAYYALFPNDPR